MSDGPKTLTEIDGLHGRAIGGVSELARRCYELVQDRDALEGGCDNLLATLEGLNGHVGSGYHQNRLEDALEQGKRLPKRIDTMRKGWRKLEAERDEARAVYKVACEHIEQLRSDWNRLRNVLLPIADMEITDGNAKHLAYAAREGARNIIYVGDLPDTKETP